MFILDISNSRQPHRMRKNRNYQKFLSMQGYLETGYPCSALIYFILVLIWNQANTKSGWFDSKIMLESKRLYVISCKVNKVCDDATRFLLSDTVGPRSRSEVKDESDLVKIVTLERFRCRTIEKEASKILQISFLQRLNMVPSSGLNWTTC